MGTKEIIGAGAVWEEDLAFDDPVGTFKWKTFVNQKMDDSIVVSFSKTKAVGGSDGNNSFDADARCAFTPWETNSGLQAVLVDVACVTHSGGSNATWGINAGIGGGIGGGDPASASANIGVQFGPVNPPNTMTWEFKFIASPTSSGCPQIDTLDHFCTKSDPEYFWGDLLESGSGSSDVNSHLPQAYIATDCGPIFASLTLGNRLPMISSFHDLTNILIDTAREES